MKKLMTLMLLQALTVIVSAQTNALYKDLPVGKYPIGFQIITFTDSTRVDKPEFDYLGERTEGERHRKVTIHLWYPALQQGGDDKVRFEEYCYNELRTTTNNTVADGERERQVEVKKASIERWFGKTSSESWRQLLQSRMLATPNAIPGKEKFPLLIGMLRPLSTTLNNEMLASNGYVVAMVYNPEFSSFSNAALLQVRDMQAAIHHLAKRFAGRIGVFGFSGSGFIPVLFSMFDKRVSALADIESGIYMTGLHQDLSASNYYAPAKLRIPFLHIFSRDLSKQEEYIGEFEKKTKFAKRYRLLLNQPALHHWDFATEGYASAAVLKLRGMPGNNVKKSFEISSLYLLHFFNAEIKGDDAARKFLATKPVLPGVADSLWDITTLAQQQPAPNRQEFEHIIRKKGSAEAVALARRTLAYDSTSDLHQGFVLNNLGYRFVREKLLAEAIDVFKLNTELHPGEANLFDSLAEAYEAAGNKEAMKKTAQQVIDLLAAKPVLTDADKALKETAQKRVGSQ